MGEFAQALPEVPKQAISLEFSPTCQCNLRSSIPTNVFPIVSSAYCRNVLDGHWYSYDDSTVEPVPEDTVSTRGAYILFYQRRTVALTWSGRSSVRGW